MRIRPITREDLPQVGAITLQAFQNDELYAWLCPHREQYPWDFRRFITNRLRARHVGLGYHGFVVVTEEEDLVWKGSSEIVGYSYFHRCGEDEGAKTWREEPWNNKLERKLLDWETWYEYNFIDRASDQKRVSDYLKLDTLEDLPILASRWQISILGVSPQHQRRGIGNLLVEHGQKMAAEEGLALTLTSSIAGRQLYYKNGFKNVGKRQVCGELSDIMMVWEPEAFKGKWLEDVEDKKAKVRAVLDTSALE